MTEEPISGSTYPVDEILRECDNALAIPYYAYGDNEAGCAMANALERIRGIARSAAPRGPTQEARETAWLVENHVAGQILYLRIDEGFHWVSDSLRACRFSRREDAEQAASGGEHLDLRICEHQWG